MTRHMRYRGVKTTLYMGNRWSAHGEIRLLHTSSEAELTADSGLNSQSMKQLRKLQTVLPRRVFTTTSIQESSNFMSVPVATEYLDTMEAVHSQIDARVEMTAIPKRI
jgi:hypothetical protein